MGVEVLVPLALLASGVFVGVYRLVRTRSREAVAAVAALVVLGVLVTPAMLLAATGVAALLVAYVRGQFVLPGWVGGPH